MRRGSRVPCGIVRPERNGKSTPCSVASIPSLEILTLPKVLLHTCCSHSQATEAVPADLQRAGAGSGALGLLGRLLIVLRMMYGQQQQQHPQQPGTADISAMSVDSNREGSGSRKGGICSAKGGPAQPLKRKMAEGDGPSGRDGGVSVMCGDGRVEGGGDPMLEDSAPLTVKKEPGVGKDGYESGLPPHAYDKRPGHDELRPHQAPTSMDCPASSSRVVGGAAPTVGQAAAAEGSVEVDCVKDYRLVIRREVQSAGEGGGGGGRWGRGGGRGGGGGRKAAGR